MRNLILTSLILLAFSLSNLFAQIPLKETLYGVDGAKENPSSLYTIDPTTGVATLVGSIGRSHVVALAVHPTTCDIYAVANEDTDNGELLKLNPYSGRATSIGFTGLQIPDMSFNSAGVLYAWAEGCDDCPHGSDFLVTLNLNTGAFTFVGDDDINTSNTGLAFDPNDRLYLKRKLDIRELDPANGNELSFNMLTNPATVQDDKNNTLTFNKAGQLYTMQRFGGDGGGGKEIDDEDNFENSYLQTIDLTTNEITNIGLTGVTNLAAIEFGELKINIIPDPIPSMQEWGLLIFALLILNLGLIFIYQKDTLFLK